MSARLTFLAYSRARSEYQAIEEAEKDESKALNSDLLDRMCGEVTSTLNMDVWPRYKEAVLSGAELRLSSLTQASGEKYVDMTKCAPDQRLWEFTTPLPRICPTDLHTI